MNRLAAQDRRGSGCRERRDVRPRSLEHGERGAQLHRAPEPRTVRVAADEVHEATAGEPDEHRSGSLVEEVGRCGLHERTARNHPRNR